MLWISVLEIVDYKFVLEEGDRIGRILMVEFKDRDASVLDEIIKVLRDYPDFEYLRLEEESVLSVPGLVIYPGRRKIYRGHKEISLTAKEYNLFYLLVSNRGQVLTYGQIYQNVWGNEVFGEEKNAVKCHIRNLREKLFEALPDASFTIRCVPL